LACCHQEDSSGRVFVSVLEYLGELSTDEYVTCDPVAMEAMPETTANANEVRFCPWLFVFGAVLGWMGNERADLV